MPYALFMVCGVVERHLVEAYKNDMRVMEVERLRVVVRTALSQFNSQSGPAKYFYLIISSFRSLNILICLLGRWAFFDRKIHLPLLGFELRPAWWTIDWLWSGGRSDRTVNQLPHVIFCWLSHLKMSFYCPKSHRRTRGQYTSCTLIYDHT